ncbi:THAP domain-containing protein 2-like [Aphis craccivora]|uniref:THAP domain-containing protein 2-like n=1 Tax=Aphis craccivora TaxID=307492 RepID=A0A6G0Y2L5_APHCR|nr:THAP domain-containing protein 2-like [Aphis craccivora]
MVNYCSSFNCTSSSDIGKDLSFHKFPLKDKDRLQKWVHAVQRKDFKPSSSSTLCSLHFNKTDFYLAVSGKQMLNKSAVPTIFNFQNHLPPKIKERQILQQEIGTTTTTDVHNSDDTSTYETGTMFVDVGVQTKLTGEKLDKTLHDLRRNKRILQQKFIRRDKQVSSMAEMLNLLKDNHLIEDTVQDIFKNQFDSSLPFALFQNEIANVKEIREFCLTLHFYSPHAYEFIRQRSTLRDPSTIRKWLATRHYNPGILHEVIDYFKQKLMSEESNFLHVKDVALIYDAMSIREGFWPDKSGKVYEYCDLGGIAHTDNEELATEALLHKIQQTESLKFANKLSSLHIFHQNKKMSVPLAVQVLSSSVADAFQILSCNNNLKNATATIQFIRIFDRVFDIMIARNSFCKGFKSSMKLSNQFVWEEIFKKKLKCEGKNILQHCRKTFALGFLINILSYKNLTLDLLTRENELLIYFLPYKISQDHAEITFSCIRWRRLEQ